MYVFIFVRSFVCLLVVHIAAMSIFAFTTLHTSTNGHFR